MNTEAMELDSWKEQGMRRFATVAKYGLFIALGIGLGLLLRKEPAAENAAARGSERPTGAPRVTMPTELAQRAGITTERVALAPFVPELSLVGSIGFDEDRVADIGGRVSGRITRLFVGLGDPVTENQSVAEIEGAELGNATAEYLAAEANLLAATRQAEREANLGRQQLTTATAVEEAHARAEALGANLRGAEQRLVAMGVSPAAVRSMATRSGVASRVVLRSPIAGEVVERFAVLGQVVDPTHPILRVADLSILWVLLDVYERDLSRVAEGDTAEIVSDGIPDTVFRGTVSHIDATIDERTRTARVRIVVPNEERLLRPGQFIKARLAPHGGARPAITVPPSAVVQIDGEPSVFVHVSGDTYELRTIDLGASNRTAVEVRQGLRAGDEAVIEGAFALKSELAR